MNRLLPSPFACLLWLTGCVLCEGPMVQAEFVPRTYQATRVATPPQLDGSLTEPIWQVAPITEFFAYRTGGDPAASPTSARILWDDTFLYLGLEMSDEDIRPSAVTSGSSGRDGRLWEGDVIEFFTRPSQDSPQYFEFEWSANGDLFDARFDTQRFGPPGPTWNADVTAGVQVDGTWDDPTDRDVGWTVEARIPLDVVAPVQVGSEWRFTVARYDYFHPDFASEQLMMSTPGDPARPNAGLDSGFHSYEVYDRLVFAVPEPATPSLLAPWLGLLGLAARRRRRREGSIQLA